MADRLVGSYRQSAMAAKTTGIHEHDNDDDKFYNEALLVSAHSPARPTEPIPPPQSAWQCGGYLCPTCGTA